MLNYEQFDQQANEFAQDINLITARHSKRLKLYRNPANQVCKLGHTINEPVLTINASVPDDIYAKILAAYELRFF